MTRALKALGFCALVLFVTCAMTPVPNMAARWLAVASDIGPADAIVVLGADVNADGSLGAASLRRAIEGILLYRSRMAPLLVFLGTAFHDVSEASIRRELAAQLGLPADAIVAHGGARTTREEARQVAELLRPRGTRRILLVTDSRHMRRARHEFEFSGLDVRPAPADALSSEASDPEGRLDLTKIVAEQLLALIYYRVAEPGVAK